MPSHIPLTGLNYFQVEGSASIYEPDLKDFNGNVLKQVIIEADADTIVGQQIQIALPELSTLNYTLDTKLVVVLSTGNTEGAIVQSPPMSTNTINGTSVLQFTLLAQPGSSMTLTPVDANNWSAVLTET